MRLLLLSNSANAGEGYLAHAINEIGSFLGTESKTVLFIPYAAVMFSYDDYETRVKEKFNQTGHDIVSIHRFADPSEAVEKAEAIAIGGGNTWQSATKCFQEPLISAGAQVPT